VRRALLTVAAVLAAPFVVLAFALVAAGVGALLMGKAIAGDDDMSEDLYITRLFFDGRRGVAKHDGLRLDLHECPFGRQVAEVDYTPSVRVYRIRDSAHGWRDMTRPEIQRCQDWLDNLVQTVWLAQF